MICKTSSLRCASWLCPPTKSSVSHHVSVDRRGNHQRRSSDIGVHLHCAGVLSNSRGSAPMSGFAFSSRTMSLKNTLVIALSHSGQTFPTLHATHALRKLCGDRVFVLTGSIDSKMSAAVGQLRCILLCVSAGLLACFSLDLQKASNNTWRTFSCCAATLTRHGRREPGRPLLGGDLRKH